MPKIIKLLIKLNQKSKSLDFQFYCWGKMTEIVATSDAWEEEETYGGEENSLKYIFRFWEKLLG